MRWVFGLVFWLCAQTAFAADCETYTSELWEPGDRTVEFMDDGSVVIKDQQDGERRYTSSGIGTGIPGRALLPVDGSDDGKTYIEHKGDVIIDNEVFTPYCRA